MPKTSNFALRTFPEFKEAALALAARRVLYEKHSGPDGQPTQSELALFSINGAFNTLIAKGLPAVLAIVDQDLAIRQGALEIAQDIMRFLLDHPAARRALVANFPDGSPAQRILSESDAATREAEENGGDLLEAGKGLNDAERQIFQTFLYHPDADDDGIGREAAAEALAVYQRDVAELTTAKGALQRALATQGEHGSRAPT